ncbi:phage integrase SAM-like domain-containing protein [Rhodoferax sp. 4810]|nr:phage integrase SAM-like domain-containing protein [Rhodoferax jenense]
MTTESPSSDKNNLIHLLDGDVVLYKRGAIKAWQARYKLADGTWHRMSTKTSVLERAKSIAKDAYMDATYRHKLGVPPVSRRFDAVAKIAIKEMQDALDAGQGKKTYNSYIQALEKWLIPFLKQKYIDNIDIHDLDQFSKWREEKFGRPLAASTITNHISALNRVFDVAVERGWMQQRQIPEQKNNGRKSTRRPAFTSEEWRKVQRYLPEFAKQGHTKKTRMMRELLHNYVNILANTGMRHGTESLGLKWSNIEWFVDKTGEKYLKLNVNGKTGPRELIAKHNVEIWLTNIKNTFTAYEGLTLDDLFKQRKNELVFRLSDGTVTNALGATFKQFLVKYKLLEDGQGNERTLYSLRHTYATYVMLNKGNDVSIHDLAKQMGTSVSMIEKHYSHLKPSMIADKLAGKRYVPDASKDPAPAKATIKKQSKTKKAKPV